MNKQRWIPVSEKLPEIGEFCITTIEDLDDDSLMVVVGYYRGDGTWYIADAEEKYNCEFYQVLAWMPMPKPYKEET